MKRRTKLLIIGIALAMLAARPAEYFYREGKVGRYFWAMSPDTRKADVLRVLGPPDQVEACGENLWWGNDVLGKNQGKCIEMIRYNFFLHAFAFGFTPDGRAVSKYEYSSE